MSKLLGPWAVIDIETTGADPMADQVIDVGFLKFEGTKLIEEYRSLVRFDGELSFFIQKLTGITSKMLKKAPIWTEVESRIQELYGHHLLAHNSDFEQSFLKKSFDKIDTGEGRETYEDSLYYLGLLFPEYASLKLERFITDWKIRESEIHRGLEDAIDLLKVVLCATYYVHQDRQKFFTVQSLLKKHRLTDWWYGKLFQTSDEELIEIAVAIDFNLKAQFEVMKNFFDQKMTKEVEDSESKIFSFDFSGANIAQIFQDEDKIKSRLPFFKKRKSQIDLSMRVGQAFKNGVHALIQAPTGTGKTMGYLLPSALFALQEKKQVLVATGTKTLQEQAMAKDVPQIKKLLGLNSSELRVKKLVGSSNHLCELLFRQMEAEEGMFESIKTFEERLSDMYFEMVFDHNSKATGDDYILRDDLPFSFKRKMSYFDQKEKDIAVDFRSCSGHRCPFKGQCSYVNGLKEAKDAQLIIANHALMFTWPKALPRPEQIIVDEAHRIEDEATKAYGLEVVLKDLVNFNKNLQHMQGIGALFYLLAQHEVSEGDSTPIIQTLREETLKTHHMLSDHLHSLFEKVELWFKKGPRYTETFWNEQPYPHEGKTSEALATQINHHIESIHFILNQYLETLMPHASRFEENSMDGENEATAWTRFETFFSALADFEIGLKVLIENDEKFTRSIKFHAEEGVIFLSAPINVGEILHQQLLQTSRSVVFTSATLANALGDQGVRGVEWATGHMYLSAEKRFKTGLFLPATFDYRNKTKVFLCDDVPSIHSSDFVPKILSPLIPLIQELGGRTLFLFSARSRFEVAREILIKEFDGKLPLFIQGMGNDVVEEFKKSGGGILLGMESFSEGIDIPGNDLQLVFVDKIPDLRMDLIIQDRRHFFESNIGNEFTDYYLAHRTRMLHQKLGRLLRTESDYGAVIVVDNRIKTWKGKTMEKFVKQMEPYHVERVELAKACEQVLPFLHQMTHQELGQQTSSI